MTRRRRNRLFSLEFFPPRTPEGIEKLRATRRQLKQLKPAFCSVTFGAGGSTREGTLADRARVPRRRHGGGAAHFLHGRRARVDRGSARAVQVARHPPPRRAARRSAVGSGAPPAISGSRASSSRSSGEETGDWFHIDVAAYPECHPQARSPQEDLVAFKRKIDAGADSAITQYFYNPDAYWHFVDASRAAGISVPIVPGIMPIGSYTKLARFSDACGAEIPRWIRTKLQGYGDDIASIRAFGLDVVTDLADRPARARRAGPALLHAEPGGAHHDDLAAPRALIPRPSGPKAQPFGLHTPGARTLYLRAARRRARPDGHAQAARAPTLPA